MKKHMYAYGVLALAGLLTTSVYAASASGIGSFEGEEEPTVVYDVSDGGTRSDSYDNMVSASNGMKATLRFRRNDWWDGDRNTSSTDRGRAEVKGLGAHQKSNETFEYRTNWRTSSGFKVSGKFCHLFQLKATNGSYTGAPLIVSSLHSTSSQSVRYNSNTAEDFATARSFSYSTNSFQDLRIRVKTASSGGFVTVSVGGGSFSGATNKNITRSGASDYRPKWGLYRGFAANDDVNDGSIEHTNVQSNKI
jgi:hypothetical protein